MSQPLQVDTQVTVLTDHAFSHQSYRELFHKHCANHPATITYVYQDETGTARAHIHWKIRKKGGVENFLANLPLSALQAFA